MKKSGFSTTSTKKNTSKEIGTITKSAPEISILPVHAAQFQIPFTHRVFCIESRTLEDDLKWGHSIILPMETFGG